MHYQFTVLDSSDIEQIHEVSLRVLAGTGMKVHDNQMCASLDHRGLRVDHQSQLIKFPSEVVAEALASAPRRFAVRDHAGRLFMLQNGTCLPAVYVNAIRVWDWHTRSIRPSTLADLVTCVRLADALPEVKIACPACLPGDVPQPMQALMSVRTVLENSNKLTLVAPQNDQEARLWLKAAAIADQDAPNDHASSVMFTASPTSPLQIDPATCAVMKVSIEQQVPLLISSCPMAGTTSPFTMAGTAVLTHAEFLAMLTISQLLRPGTPVIYGGSAGPVDLRYGTLCYGASERNTMLCANIDLANYFGLPHFSAAGSVDSALPDFEAGQAKALAWLTRLMKGTILGLWFGSLLTGSTVAPEQIMLDADLYRSVRSMLEGIHVDEDRLAYDAICRVGPGGSFMMDEHTLAWMRKGEYYLSSLVNRQGEHAPAMLDRAHAAVEATLGDYQPSVSDRVRQDLVRFFDEERITACARTPAS